MNTSIRLINEELNRRGIVTEPVPLPGNSTIIYFEYKGKQHAIKGTIPDLSAFTGRLIADDKRAAYAMARRLNMSLPATTTHETLAQSINFLATHKRVVVKPLDSSHGNGITTAVTTERQLVKAIKHAQRFSPTTLIQQQVAGIDLRLLVIDGKVAAVSQRVPASVVGDGSSSIQKLIRQENLNPLRGEYYEKPLNRINESTARVFLGKKGLKSVPKKDERVQVVGTANIGSGGHAVNLTGKIPQQLVDEAERLAGAVSLFACGVDFMYDQEAEKGYFIEANGSPSFGLHMDPTEGERVDVVTIFVDALLARYDRL